MLSLTMIAKDTIGFMTYCKPFNSTICKDNQTVLHLCMVTMRNISKDECHVIPPLDALRMPQCTKYIFVLFSLSL